MEKMNLILTTPVDELTPSQKDFLNLHNSIIYYGNNACLNLYQMAKQLELMKDTCKYVNAGFETFEDYVETCLGLKRSQAYNYIKVANSYSNEFLINNSNIGITKLLVLSDLDEPTVEKVIETVEVDSVNVKELKALVSSLKKENKEIKEEHKTKLNNYEETIANLEREIDGLKDQLTSIKTEEPSDDVIDAECDEEVEEHEESANVELLERIEKLEEELNLKKEELAKINSLNKSNTINANPNLIKFKLKYEEIQLTLKALTELINTLDDETKSKCIMALNTMLRGAIYE